MATYRDLQDRIALDYLNRYDLMEAVKRAIQNNIKCYEAQRYWFNETSSSTTMTVNSSVLGVPSDFLVLDRIEIAYSGARRALRQEPFDIIREMNATSAVSVPTHFAYRGDRFEVSGIPGSAHATTIYYLHALPALSADADTNAWTNEAANLIAHGATLDILNSVIQPSDNRAIVRHQNMLRMAMNELNCRNTLRMTTRLRATQF